MSLPLTDNPWVSFTTAHDPDFRRFGTTVGHQNSPSFLLEVPFCVVWVATLSPVTHRVGVRGGREVENRYECRSSISRSVGQHVVCLLSTPVTLPPFPPLI